MLKRPKTLGFKLGLKFRLDPKSVEHKEFLQAADREDVAYVALLAGAYNQD